MGSKSGNSFVKQAAILAAAGLLARFLGFLYRIPLTNMIGDEGNGIYGAGYYIYTFFLVVSSSGLPAAISLMVSRSFALRQYKNAHRIFKVSLMVAGVTGLAGTLILFNFAEFFAGFVNSPRSYYTLITLSPTIFIVAILAVFRGYFQGMNTTIPTAVSQVVEQIFNAVFTVLLAYLLIEAGVEYGAAGGTAGTGIGALAGLIVIILIYLLVRPRIIEKVRADKSPKDTYESKKRIAYKLIMTAAPIIAGTAIFSMTNLIDMKMVMGRLTANGMHTLSDAEKLYGQLTGKYVTLTTLPVSIATALATAILPNIAGSAAIGDADAVKRKLNAALRITMIICIPSAIGMGILADQILLLLFPAFSDGGTLLKVGAISIIFLSLSQIATGILQGVNKFYIPAISALLGALVKIPLNYFLIAVPEINVLGAVISTIACYVVASSLNLIALVRTTKAVPDFKGIFLKPIASSAVMALGCYVSYNLVFMMTNSNSIAVLLAIVIGMCIFFIFMVLINGFDKDDLRLIPMGRKLIVFLENYNLIR